MSDNVAMISAGAYFVDDKSFRYATTAIKVVSFLISLIILLVSRYAFIFFVASMLPTIVAIAIDRNNHKCASATICSFNLMGALPYIVQLWQSAAINIAAKYIIADVMTWVVVYGVSIIGVLLYVTVPMVLGRVMILRAQLKIRSLNNKIENIASSWGIALDNDTLDVAEEDDEAVVADKVATI